MLPVTTLMQQGCDARRPDRAAANLDATLVHQAEAEVSWLPRASCFVCECVSIRSIVTIVKCQHRIFLLIEP